MPPIKNISSVLISFFLFLSSLFTSCEFKKDMKKKESDLLEVNYDKITAAESKHIEYLIALFKNRNKEALSKKILFPLNREYPLPKTKNRDEFLKGFDEIFDTILVDKISRSKIENWSKVGTKGIMLDDGIVWIDLESGSIIAINYQSEAEKQKSFLLIEKQKKYLHPSISTFKKPIHKIITKNFLIRIDELENQKYRYTAWGVGKKENTKPDLVLYNGQINYEGSGGNTVLTFTNQDIVYEIQHHVTGFEYALPNYTLTVTQNGRSIIEEKGVGLE
jgi:hypothetical protein